MKRVLCPKCDNYITFDETKYTEGQSLVFVWHGNASGNGRLKIS